VYKQFPTTAEQASFLQLLAVLGGHDLYLVVPESLATEYYGGLFGHGPRVAVERFADRYFRNIEGYNALMLSPDFYGRFSNYDYVLIYQLDAWVFKDELQYWCGQGYDYIGAPWMDEDSCGVTGVATQE
jgi:hypothetical protein